MSNFPYHQNLTLRNFTAFQEASLEFSAGVNVFVGENGTGKTHLMKAMYAVQLAVAQKSHIYFALSGLFQLRNPSVIMSNLSVLIRLGTGEYSASVEGYYGGQRWTYVLERNGDVKQGVPLPPMEIRPVFIPSIDMMGHTKGFTEAYEEVRLDFDTTCSDIVNLLRLERRNGTEQSRIVEKLSPILKGDIERDDDGRFYLATEKGRLPMPLVAEGVRKIATLLQLYKNGWLAPGATLFWDEPEVNLNPVLMDEVVGALLELARSGVQVFLATHSYVILKELDLQAKASDDVRFFALEPTAEGTRVHPTDDFTLLAPNPVLDQYASLYDRELTRSTGRNRNGERI